MSNFSFTVYAPQRSGTNYLETLIASNFVDIGNCFITDDSYAWKHTTDIETVIKKYHSNKMYDHIHILTSKFPYKWIESIKRNPVDIIVRRPQLLKVSENDKLIIDAKILAPANWIVKEVSIVELVKLWNEFYSNWLKYLNHFKNKDIIKYEDMLLAENLDRILTSIQYKYQLTRFGQQWSIPFSVSMSEPYDLEKGIAKANDYLDYSHCKLLTQDQIDLIYEHINLDLVAKLNYPTEKPSSKSN